MVLNVESDTWRARRGSTAYHSNKYCKGETSTQIENISSSSVPPTRTQRQKYKKDVEKRVCFKYQKVSCRPRKCGKNPRKNNLGITVKNRAREDQVIVLPDLENK